MDHGIKAIVLNKKCYIVRRRTLDGYELMPLARVKWTYELVASGATETVSNLHNHQPLNLSNNVGEGWYCVRGIHNGETILLEHMSLKQIVQRMTFRPRKRLHGTLEKCRNNLMKMKISPRSQAQRQMRGSRGVALRV